MCPARTTPPSTKPNPSAAPLRERREPRTLPLARDAFVAAVRRDTPGTDLTRYVEVLDALLAWSADRPAELAFRPDARPGDAVSFGRADTNRLFWTARPVRGGAPTLEIAAPADGAFAAENRAQVMATLNAHARAVLAGGDRLRIGFGALKNPAARAAVLALLDDLLAPDGAAPRSAVITA